MASTTVVTAIGCDADSWRHVLGAGVVDRESCDSWSSLLSKARAEACAGSSSSPRTLTEGLRQTIAEAFQGATCQRSVVHLVHDCARVAGAHGLAKQGSHIVVPVFRLKSAGAMSAAYYITDDMLESCCPAATDILEEAEPDVLAYLDFPPVHWKRPRTNSLQERSNRGIKRRSRVVQAFPPVAFLERLAGAVMCDMDDAWTGARYFSERSLAELYGGRPGNEPPIEDQRAGFQLAAQQAIDASLELAGMLEAA